MAVKTTLEQLEEVQAAITAVMTSQELHQEDSKVVRARLDALDKRETQLLARYRMEQAEGTAGGFTNKIKLGDAS